MNKRVQTLLLLLLGLALSGCTGVRTFHEIARAGDTVAIAAGWKQHFTPGNVTVRITPSVGDPIVYPPNDPAIAAVVNLYPDPVSSLVVSTETELDQTPYGRTYGSLVTSTMTGGDRDWWETTVLVHLPSTLPLGVTRITVTNPQGERAYSDVEIVDGVGRPNSFYTTFGSLSPYQIASLQRAPHYTLRFAGPVIPYAIQVDLRHDPDVDNGGTGRAYAVNPRGDVKNLAWTDDGTAMRVLLTPARPQPLASLLDFKFYVAGGVQNLGLVSVQAFAENGTPLAGISATIE